MLDAAVVVFFSAPWASACAVLLEEDVWVSPCAVARWSETVLEKDCWVVPGAVARWSEVALNCDLYTVVLCTLVPVFGTVVPLFVPSFRVFGILGTSAKTTLLETTLLRTPQETVQMVKNDCGSETLYMPWSATVLVAQCSAIGVSAAATPLCSAIRFCKEISLRHWQGGDKIQARKRNPNPNFLVWIFSGGWGSSTWRGGGQKVRYVLRNPGKPNFWAGYPGILPGYLGGALKVWEKKVCVQFSSPKDRCDRVFFVRVGGV